MSPSQINSSLDFTETKQDNINLSSSMQNASNIELIDDIKAQQNVDLQAQKNGLSGFLRDSIESFHVWSKRHQFLAVSAVGAMLPLLLVVIPPATAGATVTLALFFSVKAVEYGYKALKWSAEKTVEGAKDIGRKILDGAVNAKDKVEVSYKYSVGSLKRGASFISEKAANTLHNAAGKEDYLDKIKRFTPEQIQKSDEIRKALKIIFANENSSELVQGILSRMLEEIESKIVKEVNSELKEDLNRLQVQKKFIKNLDKRYLYGLLLKRSLPKDSYLIDSIFSEHYEKIKEVIKESRTDHCSLSKSSSTSSVRTDDNEEKLLDLIDHSGTESSTSFFSRICSSLKNGNKKSEKVTCVGYRNIPDDNRSYTEVGNDVSSMASDLSIGTSELEMQHSEHHSVKPSTSVMVETDVECKSIKTLER